MTSPGRMLHTNTSLATHICEYQENPTKYLRLLIQEPDINTLLDEFLAWFSPMIEYMIGSDEICFINDILPFFKNTWFDRPEDLLQNCNAFWHRLFDHDYNNQVLKFLLGIYEDDQRYLYTTQLILNNFKINIHHVVKIRNTLYPKTSSQNKV